jgi:Flp pilus assembly protein TadB
MGAMSHQRPRTPAIQIRLSTLLGITAAVAVLFGTLRWLGVPPRASLLVLVVLMAGAMAAVGLVVILARFLAAEATDDEERHSNQDE